MKIAIGIPTAGRPEVLTEIVRSMANQTRAPDQFLISPASSKDVDEGALKATIPGIRIVPAKVGACSQRNAILKATDCDVLVFFDDDFLPSNNYLLEVERLFLTTDDLVLATGDVLVDGIMGPGLAVEDAPKILADAELAPSMEGMEPKYNGYGCNMAVRMSAVRENSIEFDEALPLYGWLEDTDFSRQLAPYGKIVKAFSMRGVHLGHKKSGRTPGRRLGYTQIANPVYLSRKGTLSWSFSIKQMSRNVMSNVVHTFLPKSWVDHRGRLIGNLVAFSDLIVGKLHPQRILNSKRFV